MEERMAKIEGILSQIDKRLAEWINHFDTEIKGLRTEMNAEIRGLRTEMSEMRTEMGDEIRGLRTGMGDEIRDLRTEMGDEIRGLRTGINTEIRELRTEIGGLRFEISRNFRWMLGILIPMWVTIILTILLKG
jgi:uncharacterized coiled-coil DUF342 family protein